MSAKKKTLEIFVIIVIIAFICITLFFSDDAIESKRNRVDEMSETLKGKDSRVMAEEMKVQLKQNFSKEELSDLITEFDR